MHEAEIDQIRHTMHDNLSDFEVEAFYFDFYHFYGTPDQIGIAGYRRAPRIMRNSVRTIAPDGLFWVVMDRSKTGRYSRAKHAKGNVYYYRDCRKVSTMSEKLRQVGKYRGSLHQDFKGYGNIDVES